MAVRDQNYTVDHPPNANYRVTYAKPRRDELAEIVLIELIPLREGRTAGYIAKEAYRFADAMLRAGDEGEDE